MINFSYLAPPKTTYQILPPGKYIKEFEQEKGVRRIFENVVYDQFEQQNIKELKEEIKKQKIILSSDWKESDYLRMLYAGRFQMKNVIKKLQQHIQWRCNKIFHELNPNSEKFLKEGICYTFGRSSQYRPIIIINAHLIDLKKYDCDTIIQALSYFFGIVKKHMFVPGSIENWILIIETNNEGVFRLPPNTLETIIENLNINFTHHLEKMFILNPSQGLNQRWKSIQNLLDQETIEKITFLQLKELNKLLQLIPQNQLEEKFGGTKKNQTIFWPPYNIDLDDGYTIQQQQQQQVINKKEESEEEDDPYDKVEFNLNDFMKQQQQFYYSNTVKQEIVEQDKESIKIEQNDQNQQKIDQKQEQIEQKQTDQKDEKQQREYLDEPEQPDLQQLRKEEPKEQQPIQNIEIKESTEQVVLTDRQKIQKNQLEIEQNKQITNDEQGFNSSANKLIDESKKEEQFEPLIDPVKPNSQACCQGCEIF